MSTAPSISQTDSPAPHFPVPPLQAGDRLTRAEFERRYDATPWIRKAELIEGVVYVPSPVKDDQHGVQHFNLNTWLGFYSALSPGVVGGCESSLRLDFDSEPQPDGLLRILPSHGGRVKRTEDGYLEGGPELVGEVAANSVSYDLHDKFNAYRRNGVVEYIVWRVLDNQLDWFILRDGQYEPLTPDADGIVRSRTFPGLWLDVAAMLRGDLGTVMKVLQQALESSEHAEFVARLQQVAKHAETR
jgi:Uma2 family endonuclease